jgi:prevent-host-death family protein
MQQESIGIRELRQNASRIIEAAEGGTTYRVTNHGKDTGVLIGKGDASRLGAESERRPGATPDQIVSSGVYDSPKPERYEQEMLRIVERGRNESGRVGE